ncbi:hypothetical protein [Actinomyces oris]|uniref:hypothetical protein n=1 Tax=Actinomyces oris TaxID=544580 RepID=UPI001181B44D|nr:hypothetical protein [Actinomyces oris]
MLKDPWTLPLVCATAFLVTGWLIRRLTTKIALTITPHTRKIFEKIEDHLSYKGALEEAFMLSSAGFLTMWIATHPTWALWNFITQSPETPRNTMLGATSIIALLTFVTASMASAAKERTDGPEYLGTPVSTYIFSESLVSRLLSTSEFSVFTLIVFIVPFAIDSITTREMWQTDINPHLFVASLWTSCFAVVSVILIVTLLTLLRASTNRLLQPSNAEWNIREAIRRQSAIDIKGHFSPLLGLFGDTRISTEEWVHDHLQEMQHLPKTQQKDYIYSTFDILTLGNILRKRIKLVNRLLMLKYASLRYDTSFRKTSQKIIRFYCLRSLSMINSVMQSRNAEMIRVLRDPELPISLRSLITKTLMNEAALLSRSISSIKREKHRQLIESSLLSTESKLPDPISIGYLEYAASHLAGKNTESDTEIFEALTAITFRDLAYLIQNRVGLTDSSSSAEYVRAVINGADTISHSATRTYSLNKVLEATIYASVSNFGQGSRLSIRILNEIGEGFGKCASQFTGNGVTNGQIEILRPSLERLALDHVRSTFASYPYMCAEVYSEVLGLVPASDVRPTFLHYLAFNAYQGFSPDLDILSSFDVRLTSPFYRSLSDRIPADRYPQHFKRYLYSSMTGLNPEGVDWLFGILEAEVDCHLYSRYLTLRHDNRLHTGFDTVLLWRIMAGEDFNLVPRVHIRNATLDIDDHQLTRLREEAGRAAKILDSLGKNAEADKLRYLFGVSTPKDNGRSDTQGAEDAP